MSDPSVSEIPRNVGSGDQIVPEDDTYGDPEGDEVYRADEEDGVKVYTDRVVNVQPVGGRTTGIRTFSVADGQAQRILDDDPRRASGTIIPIDGDIRLGHTQGDASSNGGTLLPTGVPLVLNTSDEIWAAGDAATVTISVFFELWAR